MIILWSDYFVYGLFLLLFYGVFKIQTQATEKKRWKKLFSEPMNMAASLMLMIYAMIGGLDSIHMQTESSEVVSVLDRCLSPIAFQTEKTYSAPFSIYSASKEIIRTPDGKMTREYPRLRYAGAHLHDPDDKASDIVERVRYAFLASMIISITASVLILLWISVQTKHTWEMVVQNVWRGNMGFPWKTVFMMGWGILLLIILIAQLMPYYHILGTNQIGEDVLFQTLKSIRTGLIIGTLTTVITLPFAILFGMIAGYFRGWIDDMIQYIYTTLSAIPGVLLIAAAVLVMQMMLDRHTEQFQTMIERADLRLLLLCAILGVTSWTTLCRLVRAETLKVSQLDFVLAAKALGVTHFQILIQHLLPNMMHIILITVALDFSGLVLAEAVLSYVGVGVDPTTYSWGMMINGARLELARVPVVWWSLVAAFGFMFTLVLAANIFSDAVRDLFDPHHFVGTSS